MAKGHSVVLVAGLCGESRETEAVRMMQGVIDSQWNKQYLLNYYLLLKKKKRKNLLNKLYSCGTGHFKQNKK